MKNNSVIIENTAVKSESYNDPEFELKSNGSLSTQEIQCIHEFCNHYQLNLPLFLITASSVLYTRYHYEPESIIVNCNYRYPDHHLLSRNDQQQEFSISLVVSAIEDVFKLYHEIEKRVNLFKEIEKNEEVEKKQIISLSFSPESKSTSELEIDFEINKSINASFSCSKSSLLAPVIKNCGRHFVKLLHSVCSDPEKNIINLDLIDENEKVILRKWSDGIYEPSIAPKGCLHQLFEETVVKYPENPAVYFNGSVVRYAELNAKANQLARYLIDKGIRNGMFIGIDMQRTPDVYISMLGVLKAGATYIPIDPGFPKERVRYILNDCNAKFLLSNSIPGNISESINCPVINLYAISETLDQYPNHNLSPKESNVHSSNIAYSIYTSGTTGNPKGVKIPHAAVAHLVRAEGQLFGVTPADKVFQGFSVAFDASVEEIWMAFHSGAALFIGTEEMVQSGSNLSKVLNENNITVWSTVPTLLSMLNDDIPSLRLLILGGEVCSDELVKRWKTPRRRMVNTYGPTESTVIATVADCNIQQKVTIGRPIPNYSAYILDSNLQMVPEGVAGELCIGGLGLSEGYINMPELTQQKFITPQFDLNPEYPRRLYRSGDLCRFNNQGDIEFLGRIDSQVKLRGFRIELAEIESQLLLCPNVQSAAVAVKNGFNGIQLLVAFIIPADKKTFDAEGIKAQLKTKLAPYMMPNVFQLIHEMPLMPSGKVNRAKLPDPDYTSDSGSVKETEECTPTEQKILQLWQKLFAPNPVELTDNFFNMGGHSLFASQMISELRKSPQMSKLSVRDVYTYPTVKELAGYVDKINAAKQGQEASKSKTEQNPKVNLLTYYTVAFLQIISIVFFYGIASMFAISPFIVKHYDADVTYPLLALYCTMGMLLAYPLFLLLSIVFKWVIIGRFKEGAYPLWGFYYFRFWLVKKIVDLTPIPFLTGTPFLSVYFRLMGAKIGKDVYIGSDRLRIFDLVSIDDHSSISKEAHVMGYSVENGMLRLGRITIGKSCFVGARALLGENSKMEDQSALLELSMLRTGASIPFGEIWRGSPARPCSQVDSIWLTLKKDQPQPVSLLKRIGLNTVHALAMLGVLLLPTLLLVPYSMTILYIEADYSLGITLLSIIPLSALYIFAFCVSIAAIKWIVLGRLKPVNIPIHSLLYIRKWIVDTLISCSLLFFKSLYATLFLPPWLRLIGAKIGKRAEISTVNYISTDLLRIDQESFLADSVNVGPPLVINGTMIFRRTHIGSRSFVGNSAVLPTGGRVEDGCLIGVLSITPSSPEQAQMKDASWLGSPPIFLPKRQESPKFPEKYTFKPTKGLFFLRGFIEFFKITIPFAISTLLFFLFYSYSYHVFESGNYNRFLYESPLVLLLICMSTILFGVFFKKLLIGKYKPDAKPLWCTFVWRNEFVNSISENLVYPFFEYMVLGTPFAPLYFRLMGCKIGKRVYMETTEITEFDLVNVGDDSSLNYICTIQTHLFEDRVMKMSHVNIGRDCNVGSLSVVLYDTRMHNNTSLSGLSLLMKGETLPENTNWQGSPCQLQK